MERNILKTKWRVLFNELKERWPDLTESDMEYINGDYRKLIKTVEIRRHIPKDDAVQDVNEFLKARV